MIFLDQLLACNMHEQIFDFNSHLPNEIKFCVSFDHLRARDANSSLLGIIK